MANTILPAPQRNVDLSPSGSLFANFRRELMQHAPFAQMSAADVDYFLSKAQQQYFAPEETVLEPASGVVQQVFYIRQGAVTGTRGIAEQHGGAFEYEAGDLFPVSAAIAGRAVTATYRAGADTFVLALPVAAMQTLAQRSIVFAEFLNQRTTKFLELSRKALQAAYASHSMTEQSLEKPLGELVTVAPVTCPPETPLREALQRMHQKRIGSMLVPTSPAGEPVAILTRYDILGRITLAQVPLETPISQVMVQPVLSLTSEHTAQDAAMLMSRHGMRHVPVTRNGLAVGMVSERDLFAMQKQSLKHVSTAIRAAPDVEALQLAAQDIRRLARSLLGQGVQARQLTAMISHLNDVLTERMLGLKADQHGIDLNRLCWLSLGSEGRDEQTIATDQDNALILSNDVSDELRETFRTFARDVRSGAGCVWLPVVPRRHHGRRSRLLPDARRMARALQALDCPGSPQDLLNASIYFDFRALTGDASLAQTLRADVVQAAQHTPRFLKQMALNALTRSVPLNWRGAIDTDAEGTVDLKLQGAAIFVDAARRSAWRTAFSKPTPASGCRP